MLVERVPCEAGVSDHHADELDRALQHVDRVPEILPLQPKLGHGNELILVGDETYFRVRSDLVANSPEGFDDGGGLKLTCEIEQISEVSIKFDGAPSAFVNFQQP